MGRKISKKTITNAVMELNPTELSQIVNEYNKAHGVSIDTEDTLKDEREQKIIAALSQIIKARKPPYSYVRRNRFFLCSI